MKLFRGCAPALVTPMKDDYSVDYESFEKLVQKCVDEGVPAIIVNGTTAEASTLSIEEEHNLIKQAKKICGDKCKVIAGTGSNDTLYAIEQSLAVEKLGVDALLIVTPYYNKTSQRGLLKHYTMLGDAVSTPIILYNVPSRTGLNISVDVIVELAKHQNIIALKDATGDISYTMEVLSKTKGLDFAVYSGNDDIILPMVMAGCDGVISVIGNVYPGQTQKLCQLGFDGKIKEAQELAYAMDNLNDQLFSDVNPICAKAALEKQGICKGVLRMPLVETTNENKEKLYQAMDDFEKMGY